MAKFEVKEVSVEAVDYTAIAEKVAKNRGLNLVKVDGSVVFFENASGVDVMFDAIGLDESGIINRLSDAGL